MPPYKAQVFQDLMLQPTCCRRKFEKLEGVGDFLRVELVSATFPEGMAQTVAHSISGGF